jgi:hypothetical protein
MLLISLTLALGTTGCDSGGSDGGDTSIGGSADVTVSGVSSGGDFDGNALFATGEDLDQSDPAFAIVLFEISSSDTTVVSIGRGSNQLPSTGEYDIGNGTSQQTDGFTALYLYSDGGDPFIAFSQTGTLTLTSASDAKMTGSFSFDGVQFFSDQTMSASGSFDADRATQQQIQNLDDIFDEID